MPAMKITIASPTPFQTSTRATDSRAICGSVSHFGPVTPMTSMVRLIRPLVGCITLERDPDGDKADEHGEEHDRADRPLELDPRRDEHGQRHPEDDLQTAGDDGVDQRVAQTVGQCRFTEELAEVVESDELPVEQRPAGERVEERHRRRHDEHGGEDQSSRHVEPVRIRDRLTIVRLVRRRLFLRTWAVVDPGPTRFGSVVESLRHQPGRPSCWACFSTSSS